MKFLFTFILSFFLVPFSVAQFVFTAANSNPVAGDSFVEYAADSTGVLPGSGGLGQTWDFQGLLINSASSRSTKYALPIALTGCPGAGYFSAATVQDSAAGYNFYEADSASLVYLGNGNCGMGRTNDTLAVYPFSYNSVYANYSTFYAHCCIAWAGHKNFKKTYDGYGTLLLPGITYNNVARIVDSAYTFTSYGSGSYRRGVLKTYRWYENGIKFPLLTISIQNDTTIHYLPSGGVAIVPQPIQKNVWTNNINGLGINSPDLTSDFIIFPNPASKSFTIKINSPVNEEYILKIVDLQGRIISQMKGINTNILKFENHDWASGLYFIELINKNQNTTTKKFIIE